MSFSPNGKFVVTTSWDSVQIWGTRFWKRVKKVSGEAKNASCIAFEPNIGVITTSSNGNKAIIHHCDTCTSFDGLLKLARDRIDQLKQN